MGKKGKIHVILRVGICAVILNITNIHIGYKLTESDITDA